MQRYTFSKLSASIYSKGRFFIEKKSNLRSPYQKDRYRIPCSFVGGSRSAITTATALLTENPRPTDDQIDAAMAGNICRCGTYHRIRKAIHVASNQMTNADK